MVTDHDGGAQMSDRIEDEILKVDELGRFLKIRPRTLYKLLHAGAIPGCRKVGATYRIEKRAVLEWLRAGPTNGPCGSTKP